MLVGFMSAVCYSKMIAGPINNLLLACNNTIFSTVPGATKSVYAPEPFDVGRILQADILLDGQKITLSTTGPIEPGLVMP